MRKLKITLAYDGTNFLGFQLQPESPTVQEVLENAIYQVTRTSVRVSASSRTDSGVHAIGQVACCQVETTLTDNSLVRALNANLPDDIRILNIETVDNDFHVMRSTVSKRYRYVIQDARIHDVFHLQYCWFLPRKLDVTAMQNAAPFLLGKHDFSSFQAAGSPRKSSVRTVTEIKIERKTQDLSRPIYIEIEADGFLYNMVRNIVGTIVHIGQGRASPDSIVSILKAKDRKQAGMTAPAQGLFLLSIRY